MAAFVDVTALKKADGGLDGAQRPPRKEGRGPHRGTEQAGRPPENARVGIVQREGRERRRLAKMLHDHLQQLLVGMKLQLGIVANQTEEQKTSQAVRAIENLTDEALAATRNRWFS